MSHGLAGVRIVGNHRGDKAGLNIANPRPGTVHQYARRNSQSILAAQQRGWWVADPDRDGKPAYMLVDAPAGADLTGPGGLYPDLVHLVTTEENFARLQREQADASRAAIDPRTDSFLDNVSEAEAHTGRSANGNRPTRFAMSGHGVTFTEGNRVLEQLTPTGVLREE